MACVTCGSSADTANKVQCHQCYTIAHKYCQVSLQCIKCPHRQSTISAQCISCLSGADAKHLMFCRWCRKFSHIYCYSPMFRCRKCHQPVHLNCAVKCHYCLRRGCKCEFTKCTLCDMTYHKACASKASVRCQLCQGQTHAGCRNHICSCQSCTETLQCDYCKKRGCQCVFLQQSTTCKYCATLCGFHGGKNHTGKPCRRPGKAKYQNRCMYHQ
uniref:Phorbol-ester/DAG-type domain-containing protein n=1 Tax=viral metagenome TaxID=1070528 RepID=A0A6C0BQ65_9ZZZZ